MTFLCFYDESYGIFQTLQHKTKSKLMLMEYRKVFEDFRHYLLRLHRYFRIFSNQSYLLYPCNDERNQHPLDGENLYQSAFCTYRKLCCIFCRDDSPENGGILETL